MPDTIFKKGTKGVEKIESGDYIIQIKNPLTFQRAGMLEELLEDFFEGKGAKVATRSLKSKAKRKGKKGELEEEKEKILSILSGSSGMLIREIGKELYGEDVEKPDKRYTRIFKHLNALQDRIEAVHASQEKKDKYGGHTKTMYRLKR